MSRWEYMHYELPHEAVHNDRFPDGYESVFMPARMERELGEYGRNGWEAVGMVKDILLLKRAIPEPTPDHPLASQISAVDDGGRVDNFEAVSLSLARSILMSNADLGGTNAISKPVVALSIEEKLRAAYVAGLANGKSK